MTAHRSLRVAHRYAIPVQVVAAAVLVLQLLGACTSTRPYVPRSGVPHSAPVTRTGPAAAAPVVIAPAAGAVLQQVTIASSDGFRPRPAYLYLPPSALRYPDRPLPVLELLHGVPGEPSDWIKQGALMRTVNAFTKAHDGQAPIVVMPDLNGAFRTDSECIRTPEGKDTETYLTGDVVNWVRSHYARTVGRERWWVAGLSEGGVCSLVLALRHPRLYSAVGDFSGLAAPIVARLSPLASDRVLYRGSRQDRLEHQPLWLLAHGNYIGLPAWFECGASDHVVAPQQARIVGAARAAQLQVHASVVSGPHGWAVWSAALQSMLPWLWSRR